MGAASLWAAFRETLPPFPVPSLRVLMYFIVKFFKN